MKILDFIKEHSAKMQTSLSTIIKFVLFLSIIYSAYFKIWHILFANIFLFILMFVPPIMKKQFKIEIPREFEFLFLIFIIATFFLGNIHGIVIQIFFGIAIGLIGFMIMLILYSSKKIKKSYFLIIGFSFTLSLAIGLLAELIKFYLKFYFDYNFGALEHIHVMRGLTFTVLGALIAALLGYIYMKEHRGVIGKVVGRFIRKNPKLFKQIDSPEEVLELIKRGESEDREFKSTLRTNLHTKEIDKKIEKSNLKTITGFLNSNGGTLLIGVEDSGKIIGIEKDNFENKDKFQLHFINIVKQYIGKKFIPFLEFETILIEDKHVLKVECLKSDKPVFLKTPEGEQFFIRAGPSTTEITGSELVEYINRQFTK
ncbi:helix-turn-helix domain-containing protein [Nanoarchaeota archaeon]